MRPRHAWHLVTGEYPPQSGGVSDYCEQVARGLAAAGEEVHVWAPAAPEPPGATDGVHLHRLPRGFRLSGLHDLAEGLDSCPGPRRLLVQYVAGSFGYHAMNLPFCLWLYGRRRESLWLMFHEYAYPMGWRLKPSHNLLGLVTPAMSAILAARARRIFVSTPAWIERIPALVRTRRPIDWLPIPSNIPTSIGTPVSSPAIDAVTKDPGAVVVGHFGTYGPYIAALLDEVLPPLFAGKPGRKLLLLGRGGPRYAVGLVARHRGIEGRIAATGALPAPELAAHIRACDLMLQPYDDGATSRRSSLMACLALGKPVVTNLGDSSEPIWRDSGAVSIAARPDAGLIVAAAEELIASSELRPELGRRAAALYRNTFVIERTLETLRRIASEEDAL